MYENKFAALYKHFYVRVRHHRLAHYPGGGKSNEFQILTPTPWGGFGGEIPSRREYDDFRSLLAYSISLTCKDGLEAHHNEVNWFSNVYGISPKETNSEAVGTLDKMLRDFFNELAVSTENHPHESQKE